MTRLLGRLSNLWKMAVDQAGFPEGENAARMAAKMQEDHGLSLGEGALDMHEASVKLENEWDVDIARVIARALPVEVRASEGQATYHGIKVAVDEAVKHYDAVHDGVERALGFTVVGYLIGSFGPNVLDYLSSSDTSGALKAGAEAHAEQGKKDDEMTEEELKLMLDASKVGDLIQLWEGLQASPEEAR